MNKPIEGWTWVHGSRKWHYFRQRRSLCGKVALFIDPTEGYEQGNDDSDSNCTACKRVLGRPERFKKGPLLGGAESAS
jgi:hypothetical protein